jgi:putative flippase GtrA
MKYDKELISSFVKFTINSLVNTGVFLLFYYLVLLLKSNYFMANTAGFVISVISTYYCNKKFIFKDDKNKKLKTESELRDEMNRVIKTYAAYGMTFCLTTIMLFFEIDRLKMSSILAPIINSIITLPINFALNRFWVFGQKLQIETL